jgi:hypothetical protein
MSRVADLRSTELGPTRISNAPGSGSYIPVFVMAASAYLLALAVIHGLAPRLTPAHI